MEAPRLGRASGRITVSSVFGDVLMTIKDCCQYSDRRDDNEQEERLPDL